MIQSKGEAHGITFAVRIVPRASRSEIVGQYEGALRVRVAAPPVDGAANRELIRLLAKKFRVPQRSIEIISGVTSKDKVIRIKDATLDQLSSFK